MYQLLQNRPYFIACLILANVILSVWCMSLDSVINFDGVTYISIAQMFLDGEYKHAFELYSWPFYSLFIAATSKILMLDVELAAYVLNGILATSLTLAFVCIVADLSNSNRRIILIAAVIVILFPSITKYRAFIIRDFGYLSCYLWSLYFIFRFCATPKKVHLLGWLVFAGLSSLFRFEGIIFVLIAPYFLFLFGATTVPHRKKILAIISAIVASVSVAILIWYVNDKYQDSVEVAKQTGRNIKGLADLFIANIQHQLNGEPLTATSLTRLLAANVGDVGYELIRRMAIFYFAFAVYAYIKRLTLNQQLPRRIWQVYLGVNILMLVVFGLTNNFLVSRYTMASALTLLILAPFAIDRLLHLLRDAHIGKKLAAGLVVLILLGVSLERLDVRTNKQFVKQVGLWMDQNLPKEDAIYSNNKLAIYYADRGSRANMDQLYSLHTLAVFLNSNEIRRFGHIALIGSGRSAKEETMRQTLQYRFGTAVKTISMDDGQYAMVFSTTNWQK